MAEFEHHQQKQEKPSLWAGKGYDLVERLGRSLDAEELTILAEHGFTSVDAFNQALMAERRGDVQEPTALVEAVVERLIADEAARQGISAAELVDSGYWPEYDHLAQAWREAGVWRQYPAHDAYQVLHEKWALEEARTENKSTGRQKRWR